MQDVDDYERHIHTAGQAVVKIGSCCTVFSLRLSYRILSTFQAALLVILALQTNDMIMKALKQEPFDGTQLWIVFGLILITMFFEYVKEQFSTQYKKYASTLKNVGFSHTFFQL